MANVNEPKEEEKKASGRVYLRNICQACAMSSPHGNHGQNLDRAYARSPVS